MSKVYEVKVWILIEAENKQEVFESLDEVLGFATRNDPNFINFGVEEVLDTEEEMQCNT